MACRLQVVAAAQNAGGIRRDLYCRSRADRVAKMGGYLFFGALVLHGALDFLGFDRAGSVPLEFGLHVGRRVIDAAGRGDGSSMAIPFMARKVVFLIVQKPKEGESRSAFINRA